MLLEADVIDAVCKKLEEKGYKIKQRLSTQQHGDDIIAEKHGNQKRILCIEAKGESSSRKTSKRYGQPFDSAQVRVHVAEALYKAAEVLSRNSGRDEMRSAIALPRSRSHCSLIKNIHKILKRLEIAVFWVNHRKQVSLSSPWEL